MKWLIRTFIIVLAMAVISNSLIHCSEILETQLNTAQSTANTETILFSNELIGKILGQHFTLILDLFKRVNKLEKTRQVVINNSTYKVPDIEKLMNSTVTIFKDRRVVGGVNIKEDDKYYYILTVWHLCQNDIVGQSSLLRKKNLIEIPESSMGMATKLSLIHTFLLEPDKYSVQPTSMTDISVRFRDYSMRAGELIKIYEMYDLALIRVSKQEGDNYQTVKVSENYPKTGDRVYVVGHPHDYEYIVTSGIVSSLEIPLFMMVDAMMTIGSSGGGVFNTDGEVIGICSRVPLYLYLEIEELKKEID